MNKNMIDVKKYFNSKTHNVELTDDQVSLLFEMLLNARIGGNILELAYETKKKLQEYYKLPKANVKDQAA